MVQLLHHGVFRVQFIIHRILRPLLRESLFSVVSFSNIVIWNAGISYYLLFLEYFVDCVKAFLSVTFKFVYIFLEFKAKNLKLFLIQLITANISFTINAHYFCL